MALFLNAQGRAEFPVQILCLLMNRRVFQAFDIGCAGERALDYGFHRSDDFLRVHHVWLFKGITKLVAE